MNDIANLCELVGAESGMIDSWHKYCQKQLRDSFHTLDDKLIFSNTETTKKDYASKRLNYPLEEGDLTAYEKLISTLYSPEERMKIEWAIGSIVCGESQKLQKFLVLYGPMVWGITRWFSQDVCGGNCKCAKKGANLLIIMEESIV